MSAEEYSKGDTTMRKIRQLEKDYERQLRDRLRRFRDSFWYPKEGPQSFRGRSDLLGIIRGRAIALEVKISIKDMNHPRTKLQEYFIHCVNKAGGFGAFIYKENEEEIFAKLREIANG